MKLINEWIDPFMQSLFGLKIKEGLTKPPPFEILRNLALSGVDSGWPSIRDKTKLSSGYEWI